MSGTVPRSPYPIYTGKEVDPALLTPLRHPPRRLQACGARLELPKIHLGRATGALARAWDPSPPDRPSQVPPPGPGVPRCSQPSSRALVVAVLPRDPADTSPLAPR